MLRNGDPVNGGSGAGAAAGRGGSERGQNHTTPSPASPRTTTPATNHGALVRRAGYTRFHRLDIRSLTNLFYSAQA